MQITNDAERAPGPALARILVAEDDDALRALIVAKLEREGYDVVDVRTGNGVLSHIRTIELDAFPSEGVDLLLLDQRMPGLAGLDVVRALRAERCDLPIVLMTAFPSDHLLLDAARLGVPVLAKPFSLERLGNLSVTSIMGRLLP